MTTTRTIPIEINLVTKFQMLQTLVVPSSLRFANRIFLRRFTIVRAFSSSSNYVDQSRGGLPRFYSETLPASKGNVIRVKGDEFWHMTKVLRLSTNDRVQLFNGKGGLVEGCIQNIDRTGLDFVASTDLKLVPPQNSQWHVFAGFGTLKGGRADWLVEKCTELGASSVTPLLTERSASISENRVDRLERVILAASKQCQRLHEMILKPPVEIGDLLHLVSVSFFLLGKKFGHELKLFEKKISQCIIAQSKLSLVATAEATPVLNALTSLGKECSGLIIVGPEGGRA
ncbi:uncharacterized protein [Cicer arietinum]|uniref:16S rRNA (uracil(1498)-N(3))-methyltransferase n=1 Tax=Cicer arietinum TaxID=3827 RepID=A0A3Q7XYC3_CICAR|nr:uncharacterized protein LOC101515005 isoform X3 [Cicer arietinum]